MYNSTSYVVLAVGAESEIRSRGQQILFSRFQNLDAVPVSNRAAMNINFFEEVE